MCGERPLLCAPWTGSQLGGCQHFNYSSRLSMVCNSTVKQALGNMWHLGVIYLLTISIFSAVECLLANFAQRKRKRNLGEGNGSGFLGFFFFFKHTDLFFSSCFLRLFPLKSLLKFLGASGGWCDTAAVQTPRPRVCQKPPLLRYMCAAGQRGTFKGFHH